MTFFKFLIFILCNTRGEIGFMGGSSDGGTAPTNDGGTPVADPASPGVVSGTGEPTDNNSGSGEPAPTYSFPEGVVDPDVLAAGGTVFKNFFKEGNLDIGNVLKSYVHLQKISGAEKIMVPNDQYTDEQWSDTFHKLGVPKELNDYKIENKLVDGQSADEQLFEGFRSQAHKLGMLPKQAQGVLDYFNSAVHQSSSDQQTIDSDARNALLQGLKDQWGEGYDNQLNNAKNGFNHFVKDESDIEYLTKKGVFDDPILTKVFANIGAALNKEDSFHPGDGLPTSMGLTPHDAEAELSQMYQTDAFKNSKNPGHAAAMTRYQNLLSMRQGVGNKVLVQDRRKAKM